MRDLRAAAIVGAVVVLALGGCGEDDPEPTTSAAEQAESAGTTTADVSGGSFTWVDYGGATTKVDRGIFGEPFEQETGATVEYDAPIDYAKLRLQVESDNIEWDMVDADPYVVQANCDKLFERVDDVIDPNTIKEQYRVPCAMPFRVGTFTIYYDHEQFGDDPPTGWKDFFDLEKYPGKRGIWNYYYSGAAEGALLADGVQPDDLYPLDLDRAFAKLDTIKGDTTFFPSLSNVTQLMLQKNVSMIIGSNLEAWTAAKQGAQYDPVWRDSLAWWTTWAITKNSPNADVAKEYMRFASDAQRQAESFSLLPYGPAREGTSVKFPDALFKKFSVAVPSHEAQTIPMDQAWYAENYETFATEWTDWVAG